MAKLAKAEVIRELRVQLEDQGVKVSSNKEADAIFKAVAATVEELILAGNVDGFDSFPIGYGVIKLSETPAKSGVSKLGGVEKAWTTPAHTRATVAINKSIKAALKEKTSK